MRVIYHSTKHYDHNVGLSACFRQWRADSHCNKLHGYALAVSLDFAAVQLDDRNWVIDFGGLKDLKETLVTAFDHKTVVAIDDPQMMWFEEGHRLGLLDLFVVRKVGCEAFANMIAEWANDWLSNHSLRDRVRLCKVEVREHSGNSAYVEVIDGHPAAC